MDAVDVKQLQKIKNELIRKLRSATKLKLHKDEFKQKQINEIGDQTSPFAENKKQNLNVERAKALSNLNRKNRQKFKQTMIHDMERNVNREEMYKPITEALGKVETAVVKVKQGVEKTDSDIKDVLAVVPKKSRFTPLLQLSERPSSPVLDSGTQTPPIDTREMDTQTFSIINIGSIAKEYLPRAVDSKFGIWYDKSRRSYMIGKEEITVNNNDVILNGKSYEGTRGLWRLLTYPAAPDSKAYTAKDLENYKQLLFRTDAIYHNNNKETGHVKSSKGTKYLHLIKKLWDESRPTDELSWDFGHTSIQTGSGLKQYTDAPIEYKYIENLNQLLQRLYYIAAQEQAGNNNFHNEKLGILHFCTYEMEKLIDSAKGTEYLISYVSRLPKKIVGSGIFNDILNKLPFELHVPGYNFLGPGTKLDKRLARGDKPVNKLDEAALQHDLFYKNHKETKERHIADKVLENKAWERVLADDANIGEKVAAWATTNAMKVKQHLGLGLKF